jgi:tetratricopeptide (TPR) repeat protein
MTVAEDRAYELMESAHRLIAQGSWAQAAAALEEAAEVHKQAGRSYDEARCLQLAATLRRSAGDASRASLLAERAAGIGAADGPLTISIAVEQAQSAFDQGRYKESIMAFDRALEAAESATAPAEAISVLHRKRAEAQAAMGLIDQASQGFEAARSVLTSGGDSTGAEFVRVEQAKMLAQNGRFGQAQSILNSIGIKADAKLRAEVFVLRAKLAREAGRFEEAIQLAKAAREAALEAVAPVSYFAAAAELAQSLDARGDFTNSYGSLATAWATLGDLLGDGVARSWVEPLLLAFKLKWGDEGFARAKKSYEGRNA